MPALGLRKHQSERRFHDRSLLLTQRGDYRELLRTDLTAPTPSLIELAQFFQ